MLAIFLVFYEVVVVSLSETSRKRGIPCRAAVVIFPDSGSAWPSPAATCRLGTRCSLFGGNLLTDFLIELGSCHVTCRQSDSLSRFTGESIAGVQYSRIQLT